jgi:hypothetical protein
MFPAIPTWTVPDFVPLLIGQIQRQHQGPVRQLVEIQSHRNA